MTVRIYKSTDGSAPIITGEVGKLTDALNAILVTGYGALSAAGWTRPYTATNGAVFLAGSGVGYYVNINDNAPGAGAAKEARAVGYETMSAFGTGTNLFPTAAQKASGVFIRKSVTADSTARPWICAADNRTFYLWILTGDTANAYASFSFGEIYSFKSADVGRVMIIGRDTENSATASLETLDGGTVITNTQAGSYLARDTQNNVGAILFGRHGDTLLANATAGPLLGVLAYKNTSDNRIYLSPLRAFQAVGGTHVRGRMRGLWHYCHAIATVSDGDSISGVGDLAGKTFLIIKQGQNAGLYCVETSNTWDQN